MARKFSVRNVEAARPAATPYELRDSEVPGLLLRVQPSGVKSFVVQWARAKRITLKPHYPVLTLEGARKQAREILVDVDKHGIPAAAKPKGKASTLRAFIDHEFEPWASSNLKWGIGAAKRIKTVFEDRLDKPLADPSMAWVIEKWRSRRLKDGIAAGTVNRDVGQLKSALAKAVEWNIIEANPLDPVKLRRIDNARVRYLTVDEDKRLRAALAKRDREAVAGRKRSNKHRDARGDDPLPVLPIGGYADHLTPMVLLALNSGLRRGELTALTWDDINLATKMLVVRAAAAKGGRSRHIPLNREAVDVLTRWQRQHNGAGRLFPVRDVKTAWRSLMQDAAIKGFTFHDLRHSFASNLVMARVDLNTVRELLGHQDLKMSLRYSHLAPEHKAAAVELIGRR